jgi:hypothetical protein
MVAVTVTQREFRYKVRYMNSMRYDDDLSFRVFAVSTQHLQVDLSTRPGTAGSDKRSQLGGQHVTRLPVPAE